MFVFFIQEVLKKKLEIQKKKHHLLQEQLKQQKVLIAKIEQNKNMSAEDKNSILKVKTNFHVILNIYFLDLLYSGCT